MAWVPCAYVQLWWGKYTLDMYTNRWSFIVLVQKVPEWLFFVCNISIFGQLTLLFIK